MLDSFEHFKNITQSKDKEFKSCKRRFCEYLDLIALRKNGHLNTCANYDTAGEAPCECHDYMYMTPVNLIREIVDTIAVSYIINFEHVRSDDGVFGDMSCSNCEPNE